MELINSSEKKDQISYPEMCENVHVEGPLDEVIRGVEKCPARHNASVVEQQRYLREKVTEGQS